MTTTNTAPASSPYVARDFSEAMTDDAACVDKWAELYPDRAREFAEMWLGCEHIDHDQEALERWDAQPWGVGLAEEYGPEADAELARVIGRNLYRRPIRRAIADRDVETARRAIHRAIADDNLAQAIGMDLADYREENPGGAPAGCLDEERELYL